MKARIADKIELGGAISALEPASADPNFRRIVVNGRLAAVLRTQDCEELGLKCGLKWTASIDSAARDCVAVERVRRAALQALSRRAISRQQLRAKLIQKDLNAEHVDRVLDELQSDGWLNDKRLAESMLHEMQRRGPIGRDLAIQRLAAKGIPADIAARSIDEHRSDGDEMSKALAFAERRLRAEGKRPRRGVARRVASALARRGFDESTIESALDQLSLSGEDE